MPIYGIRKGGGNIKRLKVRKWQTIGDATRQLYRKNAYRVLLTRARQGMIIFIPYGDEDDITRLPSFYDSTYNYFLNIGIQVLL